MTRSPMDDLLHYLRSERMRPVEWTTAIEELELLGEHIPGEWIHQSQQAWKELIGQAVREGRVVQDARGRISLPPPPAADPGLSQLNLF